MAKRMFRIEAVIYMPMEENETQETAEDRFLEEIEALGMEVYSYTDTYIAECIELKRRTNLEV